MKPAPHRSFPSALEKLKRWHWTDGHGKWLALTLLTVLLLVRWIDPEPVMLVRENIFDFYQSVHPRDPGNSSVTVVEIDEESLKLDGQWPWPRNRLASLLDNIMNSEPRMVGLDILFTDPDRHSPEHAVKSWPLEEGALKDALEQWIAAIPGNDEILAERMNYGASVVVSVSGIDPAMDVILPAEASGNNQNGEERAPSVLSEKLGRFQGVLPLLPEIRQSAALPGISNIRPDSDGIVRKANLIYWIDDNVRPSFALEALRAGLPSARLSFAGNENGIREIRLAPLGKSIPVGVNAQIRPYFALPERGQGQSTATGDLRSMMASGVLRTRDNLPGVRDHWVLIGQTVPTLAQSFPTPLGERMPGVTIQAQILENLIDETWLIRPAFGDWIEILIAAITGLAIILIVPRMRAGRAALICCGIVIFLLFGSFILFLSGRLLMDGTTPSFTSLVCFIAMSSAGYAISTGQRRRMKFELSQAKRVQQSMLPDASALQNIQAGLSLGAFLEPASDVGGDFYDAVPLGDGRILLLVADVSGKGLNAALFMALSKSLIQSVAIREPHLEPGELLTQAQGEISRANDANMFVAIVACIVNTGTGELTWSIAGHPPPILIRSGKADALKSAPTGLPMCLDADEIYKTGRVLLKDGDIVLLATDGVLEAFDQDNGRSVEDFIEIANSAPFDGGALTVLDHIKERLTAAKSSHTADDRTLLAFSPEPKPEPKKAGDTRP